jgi:SAM-dependent methyltransferase
MGALGDGAIALDVGGGRGEHAAVWAVGGVRSIVLDPSPAMLESARTKAGVIAIGGRAQAMPFRDATFDLVYFHLSIHYGDWRRSLTEAHRTLREGGRCEIWTLGAEHHRTSNLARWFPSIAEIDSARFPQPGDLADYLGELDMSVGRTRSIETARRPVGEWIQAVRAGFVSTLQLVPNDELEKGLAAFVESHPDPAETFEYELKYDRLLARK